MNSEPVPQTAEGLYYVTVGAFVDMITKYRAFVKGVKPKDLMKKTAEFLATGDATMVWKRVSSSTPRELNVRKFNLAMYNNDEIFNALMAFSNN